MENVLDRRRRRWLSRHAASSFFLAAAEFDIHIIIIRGRMYAGGALAIAEYTPIPFWVKSRLARGKKKERRETPAMQPGAVGVPNARAFPETWESEISISVAHSGLESRSINGLKCSKK